MKSEGVRLSGYEGMRGRGKGSTLTLVGHLEGVLAGDQRLTGCLS